LPEVLEAGDELSPNGPRSWAGCGRNGGRWIRAPRPAGEGRPSFSGPSALAVAAKDVSQRKIADRLKVDHEQVSRWLMPSRTTA